MFEIYKYPGIIPYIFEKLIFIFSKIIFFSTTQFFCFLSLSNHLFTYCNSKQLLNAGRLCPLAVKTIKTNVYVCTTFFFVENDKMILPDVLSFHTDII